MAFATKARLPSTLLRKNTGPPAPPPRVGSALDFPAPASVISTLPNAPIVLDTSLTTEALATTEVTEIQNILTDLRSQLPTGTVLADMGDVLIEAIANMPLTTVAVFAPIVEDYHRNVTDVLAAGNPETSVAPANNLDMLLAPLLDFLDGRPEAELRQLAAGLQAGLSSAEIASVSGQSGRDRISQDISLGYQQIIKQAATVAGNLANGAPKVWMSLAQEASDAQIPLLSDILNQSAAQQYSAYGELSAQAAAMHTIVHGDLQKQSSYADTAQKNAAMLAGVQAAIQALRNGSSLPDPPDFLSVMKKAAEDQGKKILTQIGQRLLSQIQNKKKPVLTSGSPSDSTTGDLYA